MRRIEVRRILFLILFTALCTAGASQQLRVDTDEIESLIDEWNFANNTRNVHSFEKVYAGNLMFYTENLTRRRAIELKRQMFQLKPYFRQRITTEITYKPYSKGVVKCDFTKEVFEKTYWKKYPSYLLVSYENNHYSIVGESDYATDRVLRYKLDIGEQITFEKAIEAPDGFSADSSERVDSSQVIASAPPTPQVYVAPAASADSFLVSTAANPLTFDDFAMLFSDLSAFGEVTVPKGYVFVLIAMLALGGLMIVIADSIKSGKRKRKITQQHAEAEHVVRDFKMQAAFESFVVTLFDPLFFKYRRPKNEHVYAAGAGATVEKGPDFVFDFNQKETSVRFAIKCQYYRNIAKNEVQLFSGEMQEHFRQFEEESDMDVYYVLGFGGTPDDPRELFFVPAKAVKSEYITKAVLRRYSKSGMFYYNRRTDMIQ